MINCKENDAEHIRSKIFSGDGHNDIKEKMYKRKLFSILCMIIGELQLTQIETARLLRVHQPNLSKILRGQLRLVSSEKLISWITILGADVQTKVILYPQERRGVTVEWCEDDTCQMFAHEVKSGLTLAASDPSVERTVGAGKNN
jgi:predicted XRE-type DNA-binding protein